MAWANTTNGYHPHAVITYATTNAIADLGTLGGTSSRGYGINASGQVTGESLTSSGVNQAFLYSNGNMLDLNCAIGSAATQYTLIAGQGINDSGQIVVNGSVIGPQDPVVFLLTPGGEGADNYTSV